MSWFSEMFASTAAAQIFAYLGETISYTQGVTTKSITACVTFDPYEKDNENDLGLLIRRYASVVIYKDATNGILAPAIHDTVTIGGDVYTVFGVHDTSNGKAILRVEHIERDTIGTGIRPTK